MVDENRMNGDDGGVVDSNTYNGGVKMHMEIDAMTTEILPIPMLAPRNASFSTNVWINTPCDTMGATVVHVRTEIDSGTRWGQNWPIDDSSYVNIQNRQLWCEWSGNLMQCWYWHGEWVTCITVTRRWFVRTHDSGTWPLTLGQNNLSDNDQTTGATWPNTGISCWMQL